MSITDASKATAAAPAVDQPVAETAKNVEEKTAAEEPSKEADKVSKKNNKTYDVVNHVFGSLVNDHCQSWIKSCGTLFVS